jgi:ribosome maturation protein SDO1
MNKGGKRFEIACYRNKVVDYRQGLEQDLSEVLQTDRVFTNVSKGEFAKAKDLQKNFGTKDEEEIAKLILTKGQLQVSDKERTQQLEKTSAQIAEWISKNCVHPDSDRPYTISRIRHAMHQANFSVHPTKPLKRQYLDCVKLLQNIIPIQRAKMELSLVVPSGKAQKEVEETLKEYNVSFQQPTSSDDSSTATLKYSLLVDPSLYRVLNDVIQSLDASKEDATGGADASNAAGARIEIVNQVVTKQGDYKLEAEIETNHLPSDGNCSSNNAQQVTQLLEQMNVGDDQGEEMEGASKEASSSDEDSDDNVASSTSRRKAQKKARKRNQKVKRRTEDNEDETADAQHTVVALGNGKAAGPTLADAKPAPMNGPQGDDSGRKTCNTCGGLFDTPADFRAHFKSDWHRFNQQLKMKGTAPISEKEFMLCDSDAFFSGKSDDILL